MKTVLKILGFDLGSNVGWAYCSYDTRTKKMLVNDFDTVDLRTKMMRTNIVQQRPFISTQQAQLVVFTKLIRKLTSKLVFDAFVSEDVFFRFGRVQTYRSLAIYLNELERIVNLERNSPLYKIAPTLIKKTITSAGTANKLDVQQAIINNSEIDFKINEYGSNEIILDEHSGDAIAACYAFVKNTLNFDI
jgi:Holliday junction resolvasome RuvABC endonuclease subunit